MFSCDKGSSCVGCDWKFADNIEDIDPEFRDCSNLTEVAPVRRGEWFYYNDKLCCSCCNEEAHYISTFQEQFDYDWNENLIPCGYEEHRDYIETPYCPHCGAKMIN